MFSQFFIITLNIYFLNAIQGKLNSVIQKKKKKSSKGGNPIHAGMCGNVFQGSGLEKEAGVTPPLIPFSHPGPEPCSP